MGLALEHIGTVRRYRERIWKWPANERCADPLPLPGVTLEQARLPVGRRTPLARLVCGIPRAHPPPGALA